MYLKILGSRSDSIFFWLNSLSPNAIRYAKLELLKTSQLNEKEKAWQWTDNAGWTYYSFKPPAMSTIGSMSRECQKNYAQLSEMIREEHGINYSIAAAWIRRKISFSSIKCIAYVFVEYDQFTTVILRNQFTTAHIQVNLYYTLIR